ncbi:MAG TPA: PilC/PilY family type IV pilus protein [Solimonas sp.]|nr:PilC/PilY family type IV pilus protein [Solimonas sp.]
MKGLLALLAAAAAVLLAGPSAADDTDIYVYHSAPSESQPLVMLSIDYRSNLTRTLCPRAAPTACPQARYFANAGLTADLPAANDKFYLIDLLRLSLKLVLREVSGVKVGLMMSHNQSANCAGPVRHTCSNGGGIVMGLESLEQDDANRARRRLSDKLAALRSLNSGPSSPDHSYQGKELFFELFRYLTGGAVYNGFNGWADFEQGDGLDLGTNMACSSPDAGKALACQDGGIVERGRYRSPLAGASACVSAYTINFLFGNSNQEDDSDAAIVAADSAGGMAGIALHPGNAGFADVIAYLHDADLAPALAGRQSVQSYFFVAQDNPVTQAYAAAGGSGAPYLLGDSPDTLVDALRGVFTQILAVSTTFVAPSLPVNTFNRAGATDSVYLALFQAGARAGWNGNLKKLKLAPGKRADGRLGLVDALDQPAIASDGRIRPDALTWWTDGEALTDADPSRDIVRGRDGRHVGRGGAGQKIPGLAGGLASTSNSQRGARQLFFDDDSGSLRPLDATAATRDALRSRLGSTLPNAELDGLLRYIRGFRDGGSDAARPWLMGDVLHSRPLPINYGAAFGYSRANPAIFIAVGANDGFLHFIRNTTPGGAESGEEAWAFMPQEAMGIQARLKANRAGETGHPYGVDGTPVAFTDPATARTYLYFGLRRGGAAYYALDVTDPAAPQLAWKINRSTRGFSELGLSFSTPQLGYVRISGTTKVPALFFGGGYDEHKDYLHPNGADTKGRAIYVVHALTGEPIWSATAGRFTGSAGATQYTHEDLADGIASDLTVLDTDGDGAIDRIVVGDTGGNLWRADLPAGDRARWKLSLLARLGYHADDGEANDRRFFHAPDVVQSSDAAGAFDAVIVGSGDRENPLDRLRASRPENFLFLVKDRATGVHDGRRVVVGDRALTPDQLTDVTQENCLTRGTAGACGVDLGKGWRLQLSGRGEKALSSAVTFGNVIFLSTYLPAGRPAAQSCGPAEGGGALYALALDDGSAAYDFNRADDAADDDSGLANSLSDRVDALASAGIPTEVVFIAGGEAGLSFIRPDLAVGRPPSSNRLRTFWQRMEY